MDKRAWKISILGLAIVLTGSTVACGMGFPAGLLITLPVGIPFAAWIYKCLKKGK